MNSTGGTEKFCDSPVDLSACLLWSATVMWMRSPFSPAEGDNCIQNKNHQFSCFPSEHAVTLGPAAIWVTVTLLPNATFTTQHHEKTVFHHFSCNKVILIAPKPCQSRRVGDCGSRFACGRSLSSVHCQRCGCCPHCRCCRHCFCRLVRGGEKEKHLSMLERVLSEK